MEITFGYSALYLKKEDLEAINENAVGGSKRTVEEGIMAYSENCGEYGSGAEDKGANTSARGHG